MTQLKTALSINASIFKEMDTLARKLKITRSSVFELAAREFLARYRNQQITKQLNQAYALDKSDMEDKVAEAVFKNYYRKILEEEE
jgi:metal-responsive CopG/Arc/MetJ family transcriptional regulator